MRCPDCGKFVPYDTEAEPEESQEPEFSGNTVTAAYRRVLPCGECSTELKALDFDLEGEVEVTADPAADLKGVLEALSPEVVDVEDDYEVAVEMLRAHPDGGWDPDKVAAARECANGDHEWEADSSPEVTPTMETQTEFLDKRTGKMKAAKSSRYWRTLYGVMVEGDVTCSRCGATGHFTLSDTAAASSFEEMI